MTENQSKRIERGRESGENHREIAETWLQSFLMGGGAFGGDSSYIIGSESARFPSAF